MAFRSGFNASSNDRGAWLIFAALATFLVLFPLTIQKPGLPLTLKADEPAYYLMAESIARDRDLLAETHDTQRLFDQYPFRPANNLIVMSDDGWNSIYFGKPYIYSFFAAPWVYLFGPNGMVAFNMMMLMGTIAMGSIYLRRFNPAGLSLAFSAGFFLIASSFVYAFWLHPEIFNLASIATCLFFAFHQPASTPRGNWNRWAPPLSGAALAFAVYNKPMYAAVGLAAIYTFWRRGRFKAVVIWLLAAALAMSAICAGAILMTGHPSAYLGVARRGVNLHGEEIPIQPVDPAEIVDPEAKTANSFSWLFKLPPVGTERLAEEVPYFLWGRHVGLVPYLPFSALCVVLFLLHGRRSKARWLLLLSVATIAFYTLMWLWFNWHGGAGFVGNRYFVSVYPAFFFLVTKLKPRWMTVAGYAFGGLMLGGLIFTPFGAPVRQPTLQSHVRYAPYSWFPLELSIRNKIPGYQGVSQQDLYFVGREDVFRKSGDWMWTHTGSPVEVFVFAWQPIEETSFIIRSLARPNRVTVTMGGDQQVAYFENQPDATVTLRPKRPYKVRWERNLRIKVPRKQWVYKLYVESAHGAFPPEGQGHPPEFRAGALLLNVGDLVTLDEDVFHARWSILSTPSVVGTDSEFEVTAMIGNTSTVTWPHLDTTRMGVTYHWLRSSGDRYKWDNERARLAADLAPGEIASINIPIVAPEEPGEFLLALDIVREKVGWFSQRNPQSVPAPIPVRVVTPVVIDSDALSDEASDPAVPPAE